MHAIFQNYITNFVNVATNPVCAIYLGLAAVHLIALHYYLGHRDGRPLALCSGLTSTLYLILTFVYGLAH